MTEANDKYKVADFTIEETRIRAYVLKPGQHFERFGGSRHGLVVNKTPSLIVRRSGRWGTEDSEYDVHDVGVWQKLFQHHKHACVPHVTI